MSLTTEQRRNIRRSLRVAQQMKATPREERALLAAERVESNFEDLDYGDRDSVGILQQRPSQGWGPGSESVETDVRQFLQHAKQYRGSGMTAGKLAQAVQRSAFPERYGQQVDLARQLQRGMGGGGRGGGGGGARMATVTQSLTEMDPDARRRVVLAQFLQRTDPDSLLLRLGVVSPDEPTTRQRDITRSVPLGPAAARRGSNSLPGKGKPGAVAELFYDPQGGWKHGQSIGAIGGHGDHVHAASENPRVVLYLGRLAQKMGLHVGENPAFGDPAEAGVHTGTSYHYRNKKFKGRQVGEALDISGDPKQMAAYTRLVRKQFHLQ